MRSSTIYRALGAGAAATCMLAGLSVSPASAAEPAQQGCLGETFSGYASSQDPPLFGQAVVQAARVGGGPDVGPGIGDTMQNLLAGTFPDQVVPNTCND